MVAKDILVRGRKVDLTARLVSEGETWQAMLGPLTPKQPFKTCISRSSRFPSAFIDTVTVNFGPS